MIFFLLTYLILKTSEYIVLPFKTRIPNILKEQDYMKNKFFNDIYIELELGTEKEKVPINIKMHSFSFYIVDSNYTKTEIPTFKSKNSKTLKKYEEINTVTYEEDYSQGTLCTDSIYFNNKKKIDDFKFILTNALIWTIHLKEGGVIGFNYPTIFKPQYQNSIFLENLKKSNLIQNQIFSIQYTKEDEGILVLGEELYNIQESDYMEKALRTTESINIDSQLEYAIKFDNFCTNNVKFNKTYNVIFYPEIGVIIGNEEYKSYIEKNFFNQNNNLCKLEEFYAIGNPEREMDMIYFYYICDNNFNEKNFPSLLMESKKLNLTFELDYKDLFSFYNNKKYFLVIFPEDPISGKHFFLGKPFMKKYDFTFNRESKKIGAYDKSVERYNKFWNYFWNGFKIVLLILLIAVLILISYSIYIKIHAPRKKRVFEIEDSFDYTPNTTANSSLI